MSWWQGLREPENRSWQPNSLPKAYAREPGIVAVFEERPQEYAERATSLGLDLETPQKDGKLEILYLRPLDLSVDETMHEILDAVQKIGAKRLVIDSLAGFEMALAPGFRADFRESLYRMIFALTGIGVTILSTVEVDESFTEFPFSTYMVSFLTDDIIRLRYLDLNGVLHRILTIVKMRDSQHSKDSEREYRPGRADRQKPQEYRADYRDPAF